MTNWLNAPASSLRMGVLWAGTGNAIYVACQYGMLIAIAKLGTPVNVGQFGLALAIAAPVIVLSQMQLRQLQVTDIHDSVSYANYMSARGIATLFALAVIGLIGLIVGYQGDMLFILAFVALAKAFESLSDIAHGRMQRRERMELVARSLSLKGFVSLIALTATLWMTRSLVMAVFALALVWGGVLLLYDLPVARRLGTGEAPASSGPGMMLRLARTAMPLTIAAGMISISGNLPRYFLEATHGKEAVGMFTVAATPLALLALMNGAVSQATLPRAASYFQRSELARFSWISKQIAALQVITGLVVAFAFLVFGAPIMRLLFTEEYVAAAPIAAVLAAGAAVGGLGGWGATALAAGRRFGLQLWNIVIVVVAQIPLCYLLIPRLSVAGAAWSEFARYCIAAAFLALAGFAAYRRQERLSQRMTSEELICASAR